MFWRVGLNVGLWPRKAYGRAWAAFTKRVEEGFDVLNGCAALDVIHTVSQTRRGQSRAGSWFWSVYFCPS